MTMALKYFIVLEQKRKEEEFLLFIKSFQCIVTKSVTEQRWWFLMLWHFNLVQCVMVFGNVEWPNKKGSNRLFFIKLGKYQTISIFPLSTKHRIQHWSLGLHSMLLSNCQRLNKSFYTFGQHSIDTIQDDVI